ncbi:MAG: DUF2190 family protein [Desulfobulbales bacterium]
MATNLAQGYGLVIQATNASGANIASGQPMLVGDQGLAGVCIQDIANGASGSLELPPGVIFDYPVKGHNGSGNTAVAVGDKVYYTAGDAFMDVDTSATFMGWALEAVTSGETTTVEVLLANV